MLSKIHAFKGKKKKTVSGKNRSKVSFFKTSVPQTERGHLSNKIQAGSKFSEQTRGNVMVWEP